MSIADRYIEYRQRGHSATSAYHFAATPPIDPLEWEECNGMLIAKWEENGFEVEAAVLPDDHPDTSWLGEFTGRWQPGAVRHSDGVRLFPWFMPATTYDDHFRALRQMNYRRHEADCLARQYVQRDYARAASMGDDWGFIGIEVTVSVIGVILGRNSLWGIESDAGEGYFTETARNIAVDAIEEAKERREEICGELCAKNRPQLDS
ncbi:MAG: hypothetical protein AMS22_11940 [Thiotrichales bacterium SG8_50]|nr:MAG: hypothetical protein AMS22_11940 [Thiotrichales bacterium SG8_50]